MFWLWGLAALAAAVGMFHLYVCGKYLRHIVYIFQVRPIFKIPQGEPIDDAERVSFKTADGLTLHGCYLHAEGPRRGVILFGPEYGSNCWSCIPYCGSLLKHGYDVFAFEVRGQGASEIQPGYEPLQWVTNYEVLDFEAALAYLKSRPDADPNGVGFFGISKGGGAGSYAATNDPYVRCCITDGIFATENTMVPYMQQWVYIYASSSVTPIIRRVPAWYFRVIARIALKRICKAKKCTFPRLEQAIAKLSPRPLLMIHGGADTYIKPDMAHALFAKANEPKEFWLVEKAKHNQSQHVANGAYQQRILAFFDMHLGKSAQQSAISNQPEPAVAVTD